MIEVLSRTIKDERVISLIHKYLNAGVISGGIFEETETGMTHFTVIKGNADFGYIQSQWQR